MAAPLVDDGPITVPTDAAELEVLLNNPEKMQRVFADKDLFGELIGNYARVTFDRDQSIATQVREEVNRVTAQWIKDQEVNGITPVNFGTLENSVTLTGGFDGPTTNMFKRQGLFNKKAMGARIDNEFDGLADFFVSIWHQTQRDAKLQAKLTRVKNAFSSNVPSEGGFLIPEELRSELLRVSLENAIVRPRARVIPMESLRVPFPAIDATSNVSSVYGGVTCYWTEEGATLTASSASFGRIVLDAKKLTAYTEVPNELLSDSLISFEAFISQIFPEALAFYEDYAFMQGTGVGEPLGFLNSGNTATISTAAEAGQPTNTIVWENIVKMYARMLPGSLDRAVWICSIDTFPELATMSLSVGTGGSAIWLNNGVVGPPMTILGRPVIFTEKANTLGTAGDINFVDLGFYLVGDRQAMSAMSSPHFKFNQDQTAYRIIERVDGRPWLQSAITPKNAGPTLSPFVKLATRP